MKSVWTKSQVMKIRDACPDTWSEDLSKEFGLEESTIKNIMRGAQPNDRVVIRAIEMADNHKTKIEALKKTVSAL